MVFLTIKVPRPTVQKVCEEVVSKEQISQL